MTTILENIKSYSYSMTEGKLFHFSNDLKFNQLFNGFILVSFGLDIDEILKTQQYHC